MASLSSSPRDSVAVDNLFDVRRLEMGEDMAS